MRQFLHNAIPGGSHKGEEVVATVDKVTFEKLITNADLVDAWGADLTPKYENSESETSIITRYHYNTEFDI